MDKDKSDGSSEVLDLKNTRDEVKDTNNTKDEVSAEVKNTKNTKDEVSAEVKNTKNTKDEVSAEVKDSNSSKEVNADLDPYAYVVNNGFTSEIFKIEVRGLPKYYGIGEFRKLLKSKLKLDCSKVKSPGNSSHWIYACFRSEEERKKAISLLSGYKWKGSILSVKTAEPAPDPLVKRRLEDSNDSPNKKIKFETPEEQKEALLNSVAPKWNVPYETQINSKHENAKSLLLRLGVELVRTNPLLKNWIENQKKLNEGLPCKLLSTRFLENEPTSYRNKCEFTIGRDEVTGERRVGFRLGSYASGSLSVGPIDDIPTLPKIVIESAKVFEKFVQSSKYEVFSPKDLSGHWKQLTVRLGMGTGEVMLIVGFHPQNLNTEEVTSLKEEIKDFYKSGLGAQSRVDSLHFQIMKRKEKGSQGSEYEHLLGKECIEEILRGLKFKISPASFFQINTRCAEVLIKSVQELSNIDKDTVLVDVCCGTGTIGLCLAKDCSRVLGIEIVEQAVKDAKENAIKNQINNSEFFCGKADEILDSVMSRVKENKKCVAVVDPPRAGLHPKAILMLRRPKNLDRIVFMSCDGNAAFKNFVEFGRDTSKTMSGDPFLPIAAVAVDMFPHTDHYELVIYFERAWQHSKVSGVMSRVKENKKCVAVVDPPRAGLHPKAILMLRRPKNLDRIVFMSCDGNAAFKNFVEFGRDTSKTMSGDPFLPIAAVAVDMFPHTDHYELVIYFERVSREKLLSLSKEN